MAAPTSPPPGERAKDGDTRPVLAHRRRALQLARCVLLHRGADVRERIYGRAADRGLASAHAELSYNPAERIDGSRL